MTVAHFSTPISAERHLNLIKQSHKAQTKRIKCLVQRNRRLVRKINNFRGIVENLEKQCKLSEKAVNIIKVKMLN